MSQEDGRPPLIAFSHEYRRRRDWLKGAVRDDLPATPLTHYTNQVAAHKILNMHTLWASDIRYLNDAQEIEYLREALRVFWQDRQTLAELENPAVANAYKLIGQYIFSPDAPPIGHGSHVYVICFCAHDDLLSQWRGYGGRQAPAYALSFDAHDLRLLAERHYIQANADVAEPDSRSYGPLPSLARVRYLRSEQEILLEGFVPGLVEAFTRDLAKLPLPQHNKAAEYVANGMLRDLVHVAALMKSLSFKEEQEWRLVVVHEGEVAYQQAPLQFRPTALGLIPYQELAGRQGRLPLVKVRQGPARYDDLALTSMRQFLDKKGYADVLQRTDGLTKSGISYRETT